MCQDHLVEVFLVEAKEVSENVFNTWRVNNRVGLWEQNQLAVSSTITVSSMVGDNDGGLLMLLLLFVSRHVNFGTGKEERFWNCSRVASTAANALSMSVSKKDIARNLLLLDPVRLVNSVGGLAARDSAEGKEDGT